MFKKANVYNAKYKVMIIDDTRECNIYFKSLFMAHLKATDLRKVYGADNIKVVDMNDMTIVEGM